LSYLQALSAYALWGIFPLYWKYLQHVNPVEIICHRIVWSLVTLVLCTTWMRQWRDVRDTFRHPKRLALASVAAVLISINWLVFIWSVLNQAVVDASLGYFITPLFSVVLGLVVFKERLVPIQWLAVAIAALGLGVSAMASDRLWVSLALAASFSVYGAVKKKTHLPAVAGLGMETAILAPLALSYLAYLFRDPNYQHSLATWELLALGGPVTTLPLLLFASSSKKVPLVVMGMLQYVGPTIQFVLGVWVDGEPVDRLRWYGFVCVWVALAIFSLHALYRWQRSPRTTPDKL
jgi:chloramphenicol-sensitive protein RarD